MSQGNVYKPRYKVAFQSKSKIWPYKSSRLRRFFNIRGRKLVRRGYFKRYVVVFNNMKWTVARRYIRPAMRRRNALRRRFRDSFYNKQQLRLFHGKFKEQAFRKFFKRYLISTVDRNRSFFAALERRVDIFFFRMRLLPTIFACHQYIHHYGILINRKVEHSPNALLSAGSIVSIQKEHWKPLFWYLYDRLYYRVYGKEISTKRKYTLLKKKTWWIRKRIRKYRWLFELRKKQLALNILTLKRQKRFLSFFIVFLNKILNLSTIVDNKKQNNTAFSAKYERVSFFLQKTLIKMKKLFIAYNLIFSIQRKSSRLYKKRLRKVFNLYPFKLRKLYSKIIYFTGSILIVYFQLYSCFTQLKLEELRFYSFLLPGFKGNRNKNEIKDFVNKEQKLLILRFALLKKKITKYYSFFLRKTLRKHKLRSFYKYVPRLNRSIPKSNVLTYFLVNRRYKKMRRLRNPRLKSVHWAIPRYMQVDFRTLRAVLLYPPVSSEIHHSFKCSLSKISAFYKSLAL